MASIQGIYIALFGRPADPLGLEWFNEQTDNGADLTAIGDLAGTPEYQDRFEGMSNQQIVQEIYQSLFGRNPELAGLTYFVNELNSGRQNINTIAINILDGAQGDDKALVEAKIAAADQFTAAVAADPDALAAYTGESGANAGRDFLSQIDDPTDELTDEEVADWVEDFGGQGPQGDNITLTDTSGEQIVGTSGNDTFNAIHGGADPTLNPFDSIDGLGGTDTLNLVVAGAAALPAGISLSNVEIVRVDQSAGVLAATIDASNALFADVSELWQINNFADVSGVDGQTIGFEGGAAAVAATVEVADGVESASVVFRDVVNGSAATFDEATAGDLTDVTVSGSVGGDGDVTVDTGSNTTAVDVINLALTTNSTVTLTVDAAVVTTVDATDSTGNLTIDASAITALETLNGGSGNDTLTVDNSVSTGEDLAVDGGDGNDTIVADIEDDGTAGTVTLTGGAGGDTFDLNSTSGNLFAAGDEDDLLESLVTITDFNGNEDVLDITGLNSTGVRTAQNAISNALTAADPDNLFDAVDTVADATANGQYSLFEFGGDTYIYAESGGADGLDAGDTLVKLAGVELDDLGAANFVTA